MTDYNVRFGVNSINKNGQKFSETDLYLTENCVIKDDGVIVQNTGEVIVKRVVIESDYENIMDSGNSVYKILKTFHIETSELRRTYLIAWSVSEDIIGFFEVNVESDVLNLYLVDYVEISGYTKFKAAQIFYSGFYVYVIIGDGLTTHYFKFNPLQTKDEIIDGATGTYTALGMGLPSEIENPKCIESYYSYYMMSGDADTAGNSNPHLLFYSDAEDPESYSATDYLVVGDNSERIVALINYTGFLFIFKERSIWVLAGGSPAEWTLTNVSKEFGLFGSTAYCQKGTKLFFVDNMINMRMFQGTETMKLMEKRDFDKCFDFKMFEE